MLKLVAVISKKKKKIKVLLDLLIWEHPSPKMVCYFNFIVNLIVFEDQLHHSWVPLEGFAQAIPML